ncbi:MAG: carbohydrate ABC transporter permease, partial [Lachnospiraceae bacterium]|nr:carbohydrate ABC transporter permease [Lachnospiraceae bacterium]
YRTTPGDVIFNVINYTFFGLFTLTCIFPFYYLLINTISDNQLVRIGRVNFYPLIVKGGKQIFGIMLQNYIAMRDVGDLGRAFIVTISRTIIGTVLMVIASAFVGYLVTQKDMWHRSFWYRFLVITMYFNAGLIPIYMNMELLGLTRNYLVYILPAIVQPYNIILVKTYIESIPGELEESAFIDGASHLQVFYNIIFPLCKPILATIAIFGAVGHWNSFQDSLLYMKGDTSLITLQHRLYTYLNQSSDLGTILSQNLSAGEAARKMDEVLNSKVTQYTVSMVSVIPIFCVYPFMQRYFEKGIMLGAVKG